MCAYPRIHAFLFLSSGGAGDGGRERRGGGPGGKILLLSPLKQETDVAAFVLGQSVARFRFVEVFSSLPFPSLLFFFFFFSLFPSRSASTFSFLSGQLERLLAMRFFMPGTIRAWRSECTPVSPPANTTVRAKLGVLIFLLFSNAGFLLFFPFFFLHGDGRCTPASRQKKGRLRV